MNKLLNFKAKYLIFIFFIGNIFIRVPSITQNIPPYFFCDEEMFSEETFRMLQEKSYFQQMFKAGPVNIYPPFIIYKIYITLTNQAPVFNELLILGRLVLPILASCLTILFLDKLVNLLFGQGSLRPRLLIFSLFTFSPYIFSQSRMWYPDHYQFFITTALTFYILKMFYEKISFKTVVPIVVFYALLISTKYTGLFFGLPIFLAILIKTLKEKNILSVGLRNIFAYLVFGVLVLLTINFSALMNLEKFLQDFLFNINNYGGGFELSSRGFHGFKYYIIFLFIIPFSIFSIYFLSIGTIDLIKRKKYFEIFLHVFIPFVICIYLGGFYLIMNRNINFLLVSVLLLTTYGIEKSLNSLKFKKFNYSVLTLMFGFMLYSFTLTVIDDFKTDSRIVAESWIQENIVFNSSTTFGTNEGCSGDSPATKTGETIYDPNFDLGLDYYILNDYWSSKITNNNSRQNIFTVRNHKNDHFYYYLNLDLISNRNFADVENFNIPDGYEIIKTFDGNGPRIYILSKR